MQQQGHLLGDQVEDAGGADWDPARDQDRHDLRPGGGSSKDLGGGERWRGCADRSRGEGAEATLQGFLFKETC